ncbi:sterol-4-alpha-carboxylate 3-dehydrogenase [Capsaspora owczarzaki ATCC 30864]|uniref:sterol-4-alpha-carboxylate 3-dehydrogenase n=1 Tax=Capsaspora owczarzaki (strain ATCC 30864) TaxID=595528 RepID=UPI0001FE4AC5|nr:sterol-4-alpha-carboxylate 3-dehydrogenase [Capsaspora owczarzaki ATCC 30864]|eukprot:XP_004346943.1 sterol-4-alpha-carboxylate 3-dehydrogenase [Capsaspora owczarzaki ATCC 30864]
MGASSSSSSASGLKALVIGGGGFLGRHLVDELLARGWQASVFDVRKTFDDARIPFFTGDLRKEEDLLPALRGIDVVFHCATPAPLSKNRALFIDVNVNGTKTIVAACKAAGVHRMVVTSSASVIYAGADLELANEDVPYANPPIDAYTETKAEQEQIVLDANNDTGKEATSFLTVAIRPHGIFGPRDPHLVPTLATMARAGKSKYIIGNGKNVVDFTYVKNVVHGHILAAEKLTCGSKVAGKAYHITNDEPIRFWGFMEQILVGLDYPAPYLHIPYWLVYFIALVLALITKLLSPITKLNPTFTPLTVALAGTHHSYDCARAKKDLGYAPVISLKDAIAETIATCEQWRNPKAAPAKPSKKQK